VSFIYSCCGQSQVPCVKNEDKFIVQVKYNTFNWNQVLYTILLYNRLHLFSILNYFLGPTYYDNLNTYFSRPNVLVTGATHCVASRTVAEMQTVHDYVPGKMR
jgi:hypothetical protein